MLDGKTQNNIFYQDVWKSTDNGVSWAYTGDTGIPKARYVALNYNGKMWVIAGTVYGENNESDDVESSADGITWTIDSYGAGFGGRSNAAGCVFDNKMWITAGKFVGGVPWKDDVWYSTNGVDWTQAVEYAGFGKRRDHTMCSYNGKMWIMGGTDLVSYFNDVWYSDNGADWTAATLNAEFPASDALTSFVLNGWMYIYSQVTAAMYRSTDGIYWEDVSITLGFPLGDIREAAGVVYNNEFYLLGGYNGIDLNGVWSNPLTQYCLSETPTSTVTPTVTPTATPTKTPRLTDTPTPTFTITETNTASPTLTETRDVTARATKTMTLTVIGTVTATRTVIVYALYSPTKTPTICCTKEYIIITPTPTHVSPWIQWGWPW